MSAMPKLIALPEFNDRRGSLVVAEAEQFVPFEIKRAFWLRGLHPNATRGQHAHRLCHQVIVCLFGGVDVRAGPCQFRLIKPNIGLHIPPGNYIELSGFMPGTILLVLCSEHYDAADYIVDPEDMADLVR